MPSLLFIFQEYFICLKFIMHSSAMHPNVVRHIFHFGVNDSFWYGFVCYLSHVTVAFDGNY